MQNQTELLTVADYCALPEGGPRYQLIEGELYMAPAPNRYHQEICGNLYLILRNYLAAHPGGVLYAAPLDLYLSEFDVFQPDLVFVSKANRSILADDGVRGVPDLVIEVLSPATAQLDKRSKRKIYARHGVKELWLVDPILLQIHVYDLVRSPEKAARVLEEDGSFESPFFTGLTIRARDVFARQA
ncbi:MAG: Uma2 family endonuclease [Verrucomicrobia bacterium]|nr:Uma2 family endonuclease [Verrucomicrobiota bacterium]